jgi:hypothetical protein
VTRIAEWQKAVRDHPDRPPPEQCLVLDRLALRLDWRTGSGSTSSVQLAADADCTDRTVRRATGWARRAGLLDQTRRGHRLGNGQRAASEWQLVIPQTQPDTTDRLTASQPDTTDLLIGGSTGQRGRLNRTAGPSQPDTGAPPSRPTTSRPTPSRAGARDAASLIIRAAYPDATDDEIKIIIEDKTSSGARSAAAVLAYEADHGTLRLPCDRDGIDRHSNACRDGDSSRCAYADGWCACRCHVEQAATR